MGDEPVAKPAGDTAAASSADTPAMAVDIPAGANEYMDLAPRAAAGPPTPQAPSDRSSQGKAKMQRIATLQVQALKQNHLETNEEKPPLAGNQRGMDPDL
eukprot:8390073-Alexandrium_andersonii.AAC.1